MRKPSALLPVILAIIIFAGCSDDSSQSNTSPVTNQNGAAVTIRGTSSSFNDGRTLDGQQIAEGYGMTYSETAADEIIPALPIFGFANGQPFNAGTTVFRHDHNGKWHLEISDDVFDPRQGTAAGRLKKKDLQTVYIHLPEQPRAGDQYIRDMKYGDGYFQIKTSPEDMTTTSWNTSFAYKIEIEKWNMGPAVITSCGNPDIGQATGKLFISFKNSQGPIKNSWISGQFNDAPILYCGAKN